jgi:hypothetical protein
MKREELIEFLREHLTVSISTGINYESNGQYLNTRVSINLCDEEISSDDDSIFIGDYLLG